MNTTTPVPVIATTGPFSLKNVLLLDAAVTGVNGLAYLAGAAALDTLLGPSSTVLLLVGAFLVVCAVDLVVIGTRHPISRRWAWLAAEVNVVWSVGSLALVATGALELTTAGQVWTVLQAGVVAAFAVLQFRALRRA